MAEMVKNPPAVWETQVPSLDWEDPLEEGIEPTPVFLPGESHGQRSLVGYGSWAHRVRHDWSHLARTLSPAVYDNRSIKVWEASFAGVRRWAGVAAHISGESAWHFLVRKREEGKPEVSLSPVRGAGVLVHFGFSLNTRVGPASLSFSLVSVGLPGARCEPSSFTHRAFCVHSTDSSLCGFEWLHKHQILRVWWKDSVSHISWRKKSSPRRSSGFGWRSSLWQYSAKWVVFLNSWGHLVFMSLSVPTLTLWVLVSVTLQPACTEPFAT